MPLQIVIERGNCALHRALAGVVNRQLCLQTISKPNSSRHRVTGTNEEYCYSEAKIRRRSQSVPISEGSQQLFTNSDYDEWLLAKAGTIVWPFSVLKSVLFNDGLPGQI